MRPFGVTVELAGDDYAAAERRAEERAAKEGRVPVHPFDDPLVMAGQGTIADEIRRQCHGRLDAVFVPVGGGGLIGGIAAYVKALMPEVLVIGVESMDADALYRSLEEGRRVELEQVGATAFEVARDRVDLVVRVTNDEICAAIKDIYDDTPAVMEPAGALSVAGMKRWAADLETPVERLVAVLSGANMNFDRLRERAELGEAREAVFGVTIPAASWRLPGILLCNHGADFGRVLAAFEVSHEDEDAFQAFLDQLGYRFELQGRNPAYEMFLG